MYEVDVRFLYLDLSRAFDTPTKDLILESIQIACDKNEDIIQIASTLLSNTSVRNVMGKPFKTTVGVLQGDSFSPVAFTTISEMALQHSFQQHLKQMCNLGYQWRCNMLMILILSQPVTAFLKMY